MITHLPNKVIIIILEMKSISLENVNFQSTFKRFHQIKLPNNFWEMKYYNRYFFIYEFFILIYLYLFYPLFIIFNNLHFEELIMKVAGIKCIKKLLNYVFLMSEDKLSDTKIKEMECLLHSIIKNSIIYNFLLDEKQIIRAKLPWLNNLTFRYNFDLICNCLKHRFIYKISNFMNKSSASGSVIKKYFSPRISCSVIKEWLDDIEQEVTTSMIISGKEQNNIDDHFWKGTEATQQMEDKSKIFLSLHFRSKIINKLHRLFMTFNIQGKFLNNISERFEYYLIVITCQCVLRKFGICSFLKSMFDDYIIYLIAVIDENSNSENCSLNNIQIIRLMMSRFILQSSNNNIFFKRNLNILSEILYNYKSQSLNDLEQYKDIGTQYRSITETIKKCLSKEIKHM
ncbi:hypothetical protein ACFW04_011562 [Cataglyphis niger]